MRGVYTAEIPIAGLNASKTALLLEAPANRTFEVLSAHITNSSVANNEQLEAGLFHVSAKGAPAGTAVTPAPHEEGDQASVIVALGDLTTEPTTYDTEAKDRQGFSNLAGYRYDPIPEEKPTVSGTGLIGLRLLKAPAAAFDAVAQIVFREIG